MSGNTEKLDGWGAIELHLGVDRKTVQRRGYPIRRYQTGRVYAYTAELLGHEGGNVLFPDTPQNAPERP